MDGHDHGLFLADRTHYRAGCHDHGSQFVADDYQGELEFLGIASSPAFVRERGGPQLCLYSVARRGPVRAWVRSGVKSDRRSDTISARKRAAA
jgi:hypothetical protein